MAEKIDPREIDESTEDAPSLRVNKLDVAERQLCEAIRLFFERRDPVSVHTLVAASHELLRSLGKKRGELSIVKDQLPIDPEKRQEWHRTIRRAQNFFKHAAQDPGESLEFHYGQTKFFMFDATQMLFNLQGSIPREALVFRVWFALTHRDLWLAETVRDELESAAKFVGPGINDFTVLSAALDLPTIPERFSGLGPEPLISPFSRKPT